MGHSYMLPADGLITRHNMYMRLISRLLKYTALYDGQVLAFFLPEKDNSLQS